MEEVWKDISLSALHSRSDHDFSSAAPTPISLHLHHHHSAANLRHIILQDFLSTSTSKLDSSTSSSSATDLPPVPAHPPTLLSLNSTRELHFPDNNSIAAAAAHFRHHDPSSVSAAFHSPFDQILGPPPFGKKRLTDSDNSGDRRQKRMIKNRESAARSRARKQAYANELELEVSNLKEENAKLRRQHEELQAVAMAQVPRKHRLQRTSTAPF